MVEVSSEAHRRYPPPLSPKAAAACSSGGVKVRSACHSCTERVEVSIGNPSESCERSGIAASRMATLPNTQQPVCLSVSLLA